MTITISQAEGRVPVTILQTHGDLDASNYQDLVAKAQEVYEAGTRDILLDLSDTPYMSSSGLVALQSLAAMLRGETLPDPEAGWQAFRAIDRDRDTGFQTHFRLLSPQPRVDKVLEMVGFKRFLHVYDDLDTAIAAFESG
jgi:anti-anti-sigma regulatory factor